MTQRIQVGNLQVAEVLYHLVNNEIIPGTGIDADRFWSALEQCVSRFSPKNKALLQKRDELQKQIDQWHRQHRGQAHDPDVYKQFLQDIGYLLPEGDNFTITTNNVDPEISHIAGPQLVVPVMNARYALNATNARWGSLYDALYGSDVLTEDNGAEKGQTYNPLRGARVVEFVTLFLDETVPLINASHTDVTCYALDNQQLGVTLSNNKKTSLVHNEQFVGYRGDNSHPNLILLRNNNLHIELHIDAEHPVGKAHAAGIKDVIMEAAVTTIQDLEDSVAAVDAEDKTLAYRNWLGLMKGDLTETFSKNGQTITRKLNPDREYSSPGGECFVLPGRSLLLVRNVGHLMTNSAVLDANGDEIPEGILDGLITSLIGIHDLKNDAASQNSRRANIYIVKPKMHGSAEVAFTCELFDFIEDALGLPRFTLKLGIMDEERRTSLNLKECIRAAKDRVVFINTGFLDRTGDEIHTSMEAGPVMRKAAMKDSTWIKTYEDSNVDIGLTCGFQGRAQIGKGMWAMPDEMKQMLETKIAHPLSGANTAWVPSPTAATLHAMHYHKVNVQQQQTELLNRTPATRDDMLVLPLLDEALSAEEIQQELENNTQGILGYVVRWVNQGVGCSKVPDIRNIGLMEDRATLRISSQHIANWLHHGICTKAQVMNTLQRMAQKVDQQNANDPFYRNMAPDFEASIAFQAACDLIFKGYEQPNGYTEPLLYQHRLTIKAQH
ncbi:MAG: malate synthase G [Gammaproteobacteria bacterium SG8_15]|nr:MAG: malate synthase G [Gammaproteobacteria bacterium SG8_15]